MMRRDLLPLPFIAAAALAAPVVAQQMVLPKEAPGKPDPKLAKSGTYKVDPPHTQALFTVSHLGWTNYTGQFTNGTGTLVLDAKTPAKSKVDISFPIDKLRTTVGELDTNLIGATYFDAAKFPTAHFVSTRIVPTGPATATMTGDLTIKGVTKPVIFKVRYIGAGPEFWGDKKEAIGFAATATIKRGDFAMGMDVPLVSDNVDLVINAGFEAE
jgi:polyisoprenoid-binding protein YceI